MSRLLRAASWLLLAAAGLAGAQGLLPQFDEAAAARHRIADYLAQGPVPWQPGLLGDARGWKPDFIVAADGSGTHRTVQAALDALPPAAAPGARRWYVQVKPGVYREQICVRERVPFTLYGEADDPAAVKLVEGRYHALPQQPGQAANPCTPAPGEPTHGTAGSASVAVFSDDVQLAHLSMANDAMDAVFEGQGYPAGAGESGGAQAVALMLAGDRVQLHDVRLLGHQDTLYARTRAPGAAARVFVTQSLIAGDVDFIFGDATLVISHSTVHSRAGRRTPGHGGHVLAPSTAAGQRLGFLITHSRFVAEPGLAAGAISLGRAWDHGVPRGQWQAGVSPNGQVLVARSRIGGHIGGWAASTSRRPFSAGGPAANRFAEYRNPRFAHERAREVLPVDDGWAASGAGTRGGADALPEQVFDARSRRELLAALAPLPPGDDGLPPPRIVRVHGRIDLASDDAGRPLGADDFRDPGFDFAAFEQAYDPARWGRRAPEGPLEEARQRSARRQAAQVLLRVPSRTTLIGVGADAALVRGNLLLDGVHDVIVRHLRVSDAFDHFPAWDPDDNTHGEWNSAYDTLTLRQSSRVWVDHCRFDDGDSPPTGRKVLGRPLQHHDGLLDIIRESDRITVSWSHFLRHDKTMLIGNGDQRTEDAGRLRVTLHHNLFEQVKERAPRVRHGQVHVYNNLYLATSEGPRAHGYSLGIGVGSRIVSEHNVWLTPPAIASHRLLRPLGGRHFVDRGSLHNGQAVDLLAAAQAAWPEAGLQADVGWLPRQVPRLDPAAAVEARVRAGAGPAAHR